MTAEAGRTAQGKENEAPRCRAADKARARSGPSDREPFDEVGWYDLEEMYSFDLAKFKDVHTASPEAVAEAVEVPASREPGGAAELNLGAMD